jgi:hypothetical protein
MAELASRCLQKFGELRSERTIKRISFGIRIRSLRRCGPVHRRVHYIEQNLIGLRERGLNRHQRRVIFMAVKGAATHQFGGWKRALDANFRGGDRPICGAGLCVFPPNLRS